MSHLKAWDVVAFAYQAAIWCTDCVAALARGQIIEAQSSPHSDDPADLVAQWASLVGLDTQDTEECPVPVFASDTQSGCCDNCRTELG